uniref:Uncharacterized protein n=1 Tax=Sphaerodactylus townsendi TaxID=933632 RepID=A0ACB8GD74_9SAUR
MEFKELTAVFIEVSIESVTSVTLSVLSHCFRHANTMDNKTADGCIVLRQERFFGNHRISSINKLSFGSKKALSVQIVFQNLHRTVVLVSRELEGLWNGLCMSHKKQALLI